MSYYTPGGKKELRVPICGGYMVVKEMSWKIHSVTNSTNIESQLCIGPCSEYYGYNAIKKIPLPYGADILGQ